MIQQSTKNIVTNLKFNKNLQKLYEELIKLVQNSDVKTAHQKIINAIYTKNAIAFSGNLKDQLKKRVKKIFTLQNQTDISSFWRFEMIDMLQKLNYIPITQKGVQPRKLFQNQAILFVDKRDMQKQYNKLSNFEQFIGKLKKANLHFWAYQIYQKITESSTLTIIYMSHRQNIETIRKSSKLSYRFQWSMITDSSAQNQQEESGEGNDGCNYKKIKQVIQRKLHCQVAEYIQHEYNIKYISDSSLMVYNNESIYIQSHPP